LFTGREISSIPTICTRSPSSYVRYWSDNVSLDIAKDGKQVGEETTHPLSLQAEGVREGTGGKEVASSTNLELLVVLESNEERAHVGCDR
jgi:hypothetical protein